MKHLNYQFVRVWRTSGTDAKDLTDGVNKLRK